MQLTLPLGRQEDGSVDMPHLIQKIEAAYVDNRKTNTVNDAFGLWEAERPIEITALIFFGLKDRSAGSFVKTLSAPFPAKILPGSAAQPEAAELGVPLDLQDGDHVAFRFNRNARTAQVSLCCSVLFASACTVRSLILTAPSSDRLSVPSRLRPLHERAGPCSFRLSLPPSFSGLLASSLS